jgi:hypothetical protein
MGLKTPAKQKEASGPDLLDRPILFELRKESEAEQEERLVPKFSQTFSTVLIGETSGGYQRCTSIILPFGRAW